NSKVSTRSSIVPSSSKTSQKRSLPSSRSLSTKTKPKKKPKRCNSKQSTESKSKIHNPISDDEIDEYEQESFASVAQQKHDQTSTSIQ
ncbi:unnamed protein product, partial [Rotaria sp. Silwood1]